MSWGWAKGGQHVDAYEDVWRARNVDLDPVFGAEGGINHYWNRCESSL
jgi:hypothetical protein